MRITKFLDTEEMKEIKESVIQLARDKDSDNIECGSLGVKISEKFGDKIMLDVYTIRATVIISKKEFKELGKK